jgi:hypothetical protein
MGRRYRSNRKTVEECMSIDIFWLNRNGYLNGHKVGLIDFIDNSGRIGGLGIEVLVDKLDAERSYLRLIYLLKNGQTNEEYKYDYKVALVTTPCNYGGVRYWFICPLSVNGRSCNRRVAILYLPPGESYYGCRHCHNLTYRSRKEHSKTVDAILKDGAYMDRISDWSKTGPVRSYFLLYKALCKMDDMENSRYRKRTWKTLEEYFRN